MFGHHCRRQQRRAGRYGAVLVDTEVSAGAGEIEGVAGVEHSDPTGLPEDR